MRRICIYCQTWESGGIEAFVHNVLCHMDLAGLKIDIVTDILKPSIFTEDLLARGIVFRQLSGSTKKLVQNARKFFQLMQKERYDVLHLHIFQALSMFYLLLAKRVGVSVRIVHSHNDQLRKSRTRSLKMLLHKSASIIFSVNATAFWACSDAAAKFMFPSTILKKRGYRFVPNGIALDRFRPNQKKREEMRTQLQLEGTFVIGNVGRLCYQKNQSFLLDVFSQICKKDRTARLLLIGEGGDFEKLREKASRLSVSDAVIFYGTTSSVENLLWAMDVFVFPSIFEGLGIAAIEAQASGLPTVCASSVPPEALASSLAYQMKNDASIEEWANVILALKHKQTCDTFTELKKAGFDIAEVSHLIENVYLTGAM